MLLREAFFPLRDPGNTSEEEIIHICPYATKQLFVFSLSSVEAFLILYLSKKVKKCSYVLPPLLSQFFGFACISQIFTWLYEGL